MDNTNEQKMQTAADLIPQLRAIGHNQAADRIEKFLREGKAVELPSGGVDLGPATGMPPDVDPCCDGAPLPEPPTSRFAPTVPIEPIEVEKPAVDGDAEEAQS